MIMKKIFNNKTVSGYLGMIIVILALVTSVAYSIYSISNDIFNLMIILPMLLGLACEIISIFHNNNYLPFGASLLFDLAFIAFFNDSIRSFIDYFNNITMFGGTGQIGTIVKLLVLMLLMILVEIISCFMNRRKEIRIA